MFVSARIGGRRLKPREGLIWAPPDYKNSLCEDDLPPSAVPFITRKSEIARLVDPRWLLSLIELHRQRAGDASKQELARQSQEPDASVAVEAL